MDRAVLENLLAEINGCTFATVDATTKPHPAVTKVTTGQRVILFTNKRTSGYENMVRRRLLEAGKNPNNFNGGDLPWGRQVPDSPLIEHKGKVYLKCIVLTEGQSRYFMLGREANPADLGLPKERTPQPGLSEAEMVKVSCYNLENIDRIALMGEVLSSEGHEILPFVAHPPSPPYLAG